MKQLLRSVIDFDDKLSSDDLRRNYLALKNSGMGFNDDLDQQLWDFVDDFFLRTTELPSPGSIRTTFEREKKEEALDRLEVLKGQKALKPADFEHRIHEKYEEERKAKLGSVLSQAKAIAHEGVREKQGKEETVRQGVDEALKFIFENADLLTRRSSGAKLRGDITEDAAEILQEYETVKNDPTVGWGRVMRIAHVDEICHGVKPGELWIHAAFTSELKTTLALNWAYNTAIYDRWNVMYFTLEMSYEQVRRILNAIHSTNGKFRFMCTECLHLHSHLSTVQDDHGNFRMRAPPRVCENCGGKVGFTRLDYAHIRDGELSDEDERFFNIVAEDFSNEENGYGHIFVHRPVGNTTIPEMRVAAEVKHQQTPIHMVMIDHLQIASPEKWSSSRTDRDNQIVLAAKRFALDFNGGEKIPVIGLFQINRQGKASAEKMGGKYEMTALSYANECLAQGTLVKTCTGLKPIEEVEPGERVWSRSGWKDVLHRFDNGTRPVFEVITDRGIKLHVTEDHLFRSLKDGQEGWTPASSLNTGEYVLADFGTRPFPEDPPELPALEFRKYEKPRGEQGVLLTVPERLTEDLAYLMGAHMGDGGLASGRIRFTGNAKEITLREKIQEVFLNSFGHPLPEVTAPSRPGSFDLEKWSKALHRWFLAVGMNRLPGVPDSILLAPSEMLCAFLRGLWDTDGSINQNGILYLGLKEDHEETLRQIQILMFDLGIDCILEHGTNKLRGKVFGKWVLRVRSRTGREKFQTLVGFTEPHKQKRLREFVDKGLRAKRRGSSQSWPVGSLYRNLFETFSSEAPFPRKCRIAYKKAGDISDGAVEALLHILSDVHDPDRITLDKLWRTTLPQKIVSIKPVGEDPVFDLEVTGDHEYATGGLLSHNCERSADVISYTYLNDELREMSESLLGCLKNRDGALFPLKQVGIHFPSRRIFNVTSPRYVIDKASNPKIRDEDLEDLGI